MAEGKLVRRFASDDVLHINKSKRCSDFKSSGYAIRNLCWRRAGMAPVRVGSSLRGAEGRSQIASRAEWAFGRAGSSYTVKFTANGKSSTQPRTIKLDPRVKTPQDALVRQLGWLRGSHHRGGMSRWRLQRPLNCEATRRAQKAGGRQRRAFDGFAGAGKKSWRRKWRPTVIRNLDCLGLPFRARSTNRFGMPRRRLRDC